VRNRKIVIMIAAIASLVFAESAQAMINKNADGKMCVGEGYAVYNMHDELYQVEFGENGIDKRLVGVATPYPSGLVCGDGWVELIDGDKVTRYLRKDNGLLYADVTCERQKEYGREYFDTFSAKSGRYLLPAQDTKYFYMLEIFNPGWHYSEAKIVKYLKDNHKPVSQLYLYKTAIKHNIQNFSVEEIKEVKQDKDLVSFDSITPYFYMRFKYGYRDTDIDKYKKLLKLISVIDEISEFIENPMDKTKVPEALYFLGKIKSETDYMYRDSYHLTLPPLAG